MEWDWPEENLRRLQLDKFSALDAIKISGHFDGGENNTQGSHMHTESCRQREKTPRKKKPRKERSDKNWVE